jgi:predicted O-methyltransferase YrrM
MPTLVTRLRGVAARNAELLRLPPRVALFYSRARRLAAASGDDWSLASATKPESLRELLRVAAGSARVVEIGTGTAWTTIALALADPARRITSFDPVVRPEREQYLALAGAAVRRRIELVQAPGEAGPASPGDPVDMVFIDGSHERERTVQTFEVWRGALPPDGIVAFHDYANDAYPGVGEAIAQLALAGEVVRDIFVWRRPR